MSKPEPIPSDDDAALVRRIAAAASGIDHDAEAQFCRRFAPRVRLYGLRHLRGEAAAADLMQQVMLLVLERLRAGALREPDRLASFVFGVCRMVVLDLRRGQRRRDKLLEAYAEILQPIEIAAPDPDKQRLVRCLQQLPERERSILLLSFYDELPAETLAEQLNVSPANVRVIRHRALQRLRECVTGETR